MIQLEFLSILLPTNALTSGYGRNLTSVYYIFYIQLKIRNNVYIQERNVEIMIINIYYYILYILYIYVTIQLTTQ